MKIEHICLNVKDIEAQKNFYCKVFGFVPNAKYHNNLTGWENYFLSSKEGSVRLELLSNAKLGKGKTDREKTCIVHFSIALGTKEAVEETTKRVAALGCVVLGQPRITGDGYYESSFLDLEGNMVELTV